MNVHCLLISALLSVFFCSSCGPRPLTLKERLSTEEYLPRRAQELIAAKHLPDRAPMTSLELVRAMFREHSLLKNRLPSPLTPGELRAMSIRRPGKGEVGDLVYFRELSRTLDYAIVYEVISKTRYRAIGLLLGEVRRIELDLSSPQTRRVGDQVINTIIRPIKETDSPPHLYLSGALFDEFRRLF